MVTWAAQVRQLTALRWFISRWSTHSSSALFDVYHLPAVMACSLPGINTSEILISNEACKRQSDTRSMQPANSLGEETKRGSLTLEQLKRTSLFRNDRGLKTILRGQRPMCGKRLIHLILSNDDEGNYPRGTQQEQWNRRLRNCNHAVCVWKMSPNIDVTWRVGTKHSATIRICNHRRIPKIRGGNRDAFRFVL